MDKNTIIGFLLIAVILIGFAWYNQPSEEELKAQQELVEKQAAEQKKQAAQLAKKKAQQQQLRDSVMEDTSALFHAALKGEAQRIVLKNQKLELTLNSKGATVEKAVVKGYKNRDGGPDVTLFQGKDQQLSYALAAKEFNVVTSDLYFTPSEVTDSTVTFTAQADADKALVLKYRLGKDYMLHASLQAQNMAGLFAPDARTLDVNWKQLMAQQEHGFTFENRYAALTYHNVEGGTDKLNEAKEVTDKAIEKPTDWVAFKDQYFTSIIIAKGNFKENALLTSIPQQKGSGYLKDYEAKLKTQFDPTGKTPTQFEFYYGPNDFRLLRKIEKQSEFGKELELQRLVYLGWPIIRIINRWFTIYIFDWLTNLNINMGIVLILITLLLKVITYPMVKKSYMSSAKMRVLKPKLDAATAQYDKPEDQMMKQQAMMTEYAKYGVSPLSGCLPMLIQMPIWIAMFNFVPNAIELRGESFLWIKDLSTYDPIIEWNHNLWLIGDHLSLTCILFCGAQIIYSWFTMKLQKDQMVGQQAEQMKMMQWMMYLMPLIFFFMFNDYSSGLNFYYFVSLMFSAIIMFTLRHTTNDEKLLAILEAHYNENKGKQATGKVSGFAARLQRMQEEQMELQRKREELERKKKGL